MKTQISFNLTFAVATQLKVGVVCNVFPIKESNGVCTCVVGILGNPSCNANSKTYATLALIHFLFFTTG